MPQASAAQAVLPFGDLPDETLGWDQILCAAFADPNRTSGFLPQAEAAVLAHPADGVVLLLAATAALLDQNPERAQVFLRRFSKRYVAIGAYHLLRALALAQENRRGLARSELETHGLADRFDALRNFPGGWIRREWLFRQHDRILERKNAGRRERAASDPERNRSSAQV